MMIANLSGKNQLTFYISSKIYELARLRQREAVSGKNHYNYGKSLKESTKEKLRQHMIGRKMPEGTGAKVALTKIGKPLSKEHKLTLSKAHKGYKHSEKHKQERRERMLSHPSNFKKVQCVKTGLVFTTCQLAAEYFKVHPDTIRNRAKRGLFNYLN